jgi:predicted transcriptional regulator
MREFGQLESAVMEVVWAQDQPCLVREVRERLQYPRPVAYTTVMTVMTILHGKGVLRREKQGRAWRYWPAEAREEHDARLMAEALRSGGDRRVTLRRFAELATEEELDALRRAARAVRTARAVRSAPSAARVLPRRRAG